MHTLQYIMRTLIHPPQPLPRRRSPGKKHHAPRPHFRHGIDNLLGEFLPAVIGVAVGFARFDRQAGVEHQHAAVGPGGEQAAILGRGQERRVVVFKGDVDVFEGWGGAGRWADGESEAVSLVGPVVGVLAYYHGFDGWERGMLGPGWRRGG